jgi:hypothetical protein
MKKGGGAMASQPIYEFYAELEDYTPKMWRRFQVANNVTMARLGYILLTLFEMQASHLFRIEVPFRENLRMSLNNRLGDEGYNQLVADNQLNDIEENSIFEIITEETYLYRDEDDKVYDATEHKLKHVINDPGSRLSLVYDFGDNWTVAVTLKRVFKDGSLSGRLLPRVLKGEGYGIVEDCGGVGGLTRLAKAFKKKRGNEYEEYRQWLGMDDFDLEVFDIDDMNFRLLKVPRIYSDAYEYGLEPTKRSMDILERRYLTKKSR